MELVQTLLLAALNVEFLAVLWLSRPEPKPRAKQMAANHAEVAERDKRIQELIQAADPTWQPGEPRDHLEFLIDKQTCLITGVRKRVPQ